MIDLPRCIAMRNQTADSCLEHDVIQQEVEARLLDQLQFIRHQPKTLLELGCSTGRLAEQLCAHYPGLSTYIGCDISAERLPKNTAQQTYKLQITPDAIDQAPGTVDLVIANLYWHWVDDMPALLSRVQSILAPGGLLLFTTFGLQTLQELKQAWRAVDTHAHVQNFDDMHDLGDAVLAAGFADPVLFNETLTVEYRALKTLFADLKGQGAGFCYVERMRHVLSRARYAALCAAYPQREGIYPASFEIIYGQAWKAEDRDRATLNDQGEAAVKIERIQRRTGSD